MRGKPISGLTGVTANRITPAGAGKTSLHVYAHGFYWDHPRRCGENTKTAATDFTCLGSPPQVRGKLFNKIREAMPPGITPAGAGKTEEWKSKYEKEQDHPRRCGENCKGPCLQTAMMGSPPQVRGKPMQNTLRNAAIRITPAGAGKTVSFIYQPFGG